MSFMPHSIVDTDSSHTETHDSLGTSSNLPSNRNDQISISHDYEPLIHCEYLINLSNQRPAFFSRFSKVAEILDDNEEIITAGRKRYSFYRDRGYTLGYYQL